MRRAAAPPRSRVAPRRDREASACEPPQARRFERVRESDRGARWHRRRGAHQARVPRARGGAPLGSRSLRPPPPPLPLLLGGQSTASSSMRKPWTTVSSLPPPVRRRPQQFSAGSSTHAAARSPRSTRCWLNGGRSQRRRDHAAALASPVATSASARASTLSCVVAHRPSPVSVSETIPFAAARSRLHSTPSLLPLRPPPTGSMMMMIC